MGILDNLFKSTHLSSSQEPRYMEVEWGKDSTEGGKSFVRVVNFNEYTDTEVVLNYLRDRRNIVVLKIKPRLLQEKMELKRALKRIQRTAAAIGGDMAGLKEDVILITPPDVSIYRGAHPDVEATVSVSQGEEAAV